MSAASWRRLILAPIAFADNRLGARCLRRVVRRKQNRAKVTGALTGAQCTV